MSRIFFFLLALFSASSQAFTTLDPYMVPAEVRNVNSFISVDGDTVKVNVTGKGFGANQPYFNKVVSIPKANFVSWVKSNLKNLIKINPWWIAWAAAMAAFGWAFDELLNQMNQSFAVHYGRCREGSDFNYGNILSQSIDAPECAKLVANVAPFTYAGSYVWKSGPKTPTLNQPTVYAANAKWNGQVYERQFNIVYLTSKVQVSPVPDDALLDKIFPSMISDPVAASQAFMQPGSNPYPYDDLFRGVDMNYIPGVSEADYPALDCYFRGALQSSNASGPCYATESEYQRVRQIAEQLKAGKTPQGHVDAMNDQLKNPLTQAQLEESLNKLSGADVSKVTDDASKIYDSGFKQLNDSLVANTLPSMPDLVPLPQFQTGSCRSFTINFSLAGVNVTKLFPGESGCAQFEKLKQFLGWFMAISVVIGLTFAALREAN